MYVIKERKVLALSFLDKEIIILKLDCEFIIAPRILFNDKCLSNTDRVVLALIISLTLNKGYCYATNEYLASYVNSSVRTISYSLSKLRSLKYIIIKYENKKRRIYLNMEKIPTKVADNSAESCNEEVDKNCTHNINNNKYKSKYNKRKENIPYWMEHSEVCEKNPLNEED